eukprot:gene9883-biopygen32535
MRPRADRFDSTLGFPGEGWKGRRGARERLSRVLFAFHNVQTLAGHVVTKGRSVDMCGDVTKEHMIIDYANNNDLYLLGIAEHRWIMEGERSAPSNWHCIHTSANVSSGEGYKGGVGCYLSPKATRAWRNFGSHVEYIDNRILLLRLPLDARRTASAFIYYAPHSQRPRSERQAFWDSLESAIAQVPSSDVILLLGDSNADTGDIHSPGITGTHGTGKCNATGEELIDWCRNLGLRIMNGFFEKSSGTCQTWRRPARPPLPWTQGLTLDHCIVRSKDAAVVTDVAILEPIEYSSDHRMVVAAITPLRGRGAWQRKME